MTHQELDMLWVESDGQVTLPSQDLRELIDLADECGGILGVLWGDRHAMVDHQWGLAVARYDRWNR